jgi:IrrE N-terminal-like domain
MKSDYLVQFRREETIAQSASELRKLANLAGRDFFNVADLFRSFVSQKLKNGPVQLILFDAKPDDYPASVKYRPSRLKCDRGVWEDADIGEPKARWVLGHEIGHLVLHDHHAKAFSSDPALRIKFAQKEYSAEWQADTFAGYLYMPDEMLGQVASPSEAALKYGVPIEFATDRFETLQSKNLRARRYEGDLCPTCGALLDGKNGTNIACRNCDRSY